MSEREKGIVWLLLCMILFLNADQMIMSPNIGAIEKEFHITDREIGYIAASFTVIGACLSLIWGFLADKYNRKQLLLISTWIGEIPCFLSAFATSYTQLFIFRALTGIGIGAVFPVVFSYASDMFEEKERGKINALLSMAISMGAILGMVLAGFMGKTYGWRLPFILVSLPNVLITLVFYMVASEPCRGEAEAELKNLIKQGYRYNENVKFRDYLALFRIKTNLILFIQGMLGTVPWGAIPYYLVEFLQRFQGLTQIQATWVFIFFGVGNIVGTYLGGIAGAFLYHKQKSYMPYFCSLTTFIGVFLVFLSLLYPLGGFATLSFLGFIASSMISITAPNIKTMLMNVNIPENRGRIFSIFNLTDSVGTGIGKALAGYFSVSFGSLGIAMNLCALFWLPCAAVLLLAGKTFSPDVSRLRKAMKNRALGMRYDA